MSSHPSLRPTWTSAGNLRTVLLGLASGGVCLAAVSPRRRCALTAPFHPCLCETHVKPRHRRCVSVALSRGFPRVGVPTTSPCDVRTFLDGLSLPPRLLGLHDRGYRAPSRGSTGGGRRSRTMRGHRARRPAAPRRDRPAPYAAASAPTSGTGARSPRGRRARPASAADRARRRAPAAFAIRGSSGRAGPAPAGAAQHDALGGERTDNRELLEVRHRVLGRPCARRRSPSRRPSRGRVREARGRSPTCASGTPANLRARRRPAGRERRGLLAPRRPPPRRARRAGGGRS